MANNILTGLNCKVAKVAATFSSMNFNSSNVSIIYEIEGNTIKSWRPNRPVNSVTGTTISDTKGYFIEALQDLDRSAEFAGPLPVGGGTNFDAPSFINVEMYK